MATNPLNITAGKITTIKYDMSPSTGASADPSTNTYVDAGYTVDGVDVELDSKVERINVDQVEMGVRGAISEQTAKLKLMMAEHIRGVMGISIPGATTENTAGVSDTARYGSPSGDTKKEFALQITSPGPNSTTRTIVFPRATIMGAAKTEFKRGAAALFEVTIGALYAGNNVPLVTAVDA